MPKDAPAFPLRFPELPLWSTAQIRFHLEVPPKELIDQLHELSLLSNRQMALFCQAKKS
jgi:hypothetical protein